jgi:hypothetical protein
LALPTILAWSVAVMIEEAPQLAPAGFTLSGGRCSDQENSCEPPAVRA